VRTRRVISVVAAPALLALFAVCGGELLAVRVHGQEKPDQLHNGRPPENGTGEIEVLPVQGNVYMIAGRGSNIAVQVGDQGAFVVDTSVADIGDMVIAEVKKLTKGPIKGVINTNTDPDHIGGNEKISKAGSPLYGAAGGTNEGAPVFAHEKALNQISAPSGKTSTVPFALWPTDTFAAEKKKIYFNHEAIEIFYQPGHTDGDVMVFFRRSDVIAAGDVFVTTSYPRIDAARGGSLGGVLSGLNHIVDIAVPELNQQGGTRIIPGHGRIANQSDVVEYRDMVTIVRDRVQDLIRAGKTLEQIKAAKPTLDYDGLYSTPSYTGEMFIDAVYQNLGKAAKPEPARTTRKSKP
jgi:cyclase